jgi:ABC-2 type transport system ATP-binding protein
MSEGTAVIDCEGVSRWYGSVLGLNRVTVRVGAGITGLLGPNGAGKSTFMKLVTGQLKPSSGRVRVLGEPVWDNPRLMRRLGYCPEFDELYESMTGLELVTLLTRLHGYAPRDARQRARDALERVRLGDALERPVAGYSKGMRQKVKLAQALAHDPELLVLDEPLTGTDPVSRHHLIELIRGLAREQGVHVLVSSHVLYEIEALTQTMLLIDHGRVLAEGTVDDIRDLIDEHPHRVRIACDRPRELAQLLVAEPWVAGLHVEDGVVEVETADPSACYAGVPRLAAEGGFSLRSLESPDNNMEAVFRYLIGGGRVSSRRQS